MHDVQKQILDYLKLVLDFFCTERQGFHNEDETKCFEVCSQLYGGAYVAPVKASGVRQFAAHDGPGTTTSIHPAYPPNNGTPINEHDPSNVPGRNSLSRATLCGRSDLRL